MVQDVAALVPVLPTHVLAVLLVSSNSAAWSVQTLAEEGIVLLEKFRRQGAKICLYDADEQQVFVSVVEDFTRRKLVTVGAEGLLAINPEKKRLLNYMANSVSHLLVRA
jgi:hypothetical protein